MNLASNLLKAKAIWGDHSELLPFFDSKPCMVSLYLPAPTPGSQYSLLLSASSSISALCRALLSYPKATLAS